MDLKRGTGLVYGLLAGVWLLVAAWQAEEHFRVAGAAANDLRGGAREIARTLSAVTHALQFRGTIGEERLDPVLGELVRIRTNALVSSSQLSALALLNTEGDPVVTVGDTNLLTGMNPAEAEHWAAETVTFVLPVEGASVSPEGVANGAPVVLPRFAGTNGPPRTRDFPRGEPRPDGMDATNGRPFPQTNFPPPTNAAGQFGPPPDGGDRQRGGGRRPPWMRWMSETEFKALAAKRELHGLVLVMSTEKYRAARTRDWWLRGIIAFFAAGAAVGAAFAWRNFGKTAELQIRLVRASELNSHLKELNLAAAGLAHETRNPLNIIRGQAQMLARAPGAPPDVSEKSRLIVAETDKVTAQLTEFINYSRPREVRRAKVAPAAIANEVARTLAFDIEEKKLRVEVTGENFAVEADEQLLRQVLFNLLINAIQAAGEGGTIQFALARAGKGEAVLEVRDDGPGVPPENRREIFKPYFTSHQQGTGLGLAVVQQIVHTHGWEIECLGNGLQGAVFRISHLKIAA